MTGTMAVGNATSTPTAAITSTPTTVCKQDDIGCLLKQRKEETGMTLLERYNAGISKSDTEAYCKKHTTLCGLRKIDDKLRAFVTKPRTTILNLFK